MVREVNGRPTFHPDGAVFEQSCLRRGPFDSPVEHTIAPCGCSEFFFRPSVVVVGAWLVLVGRREREFAFLEGAQYGSAEVLCTRQQVAAAEGPQWVASSEGKGFEGNAGK